MQPGSRTISSLVNSFKLTARLQVHHRRCLCTSENAAEALPPKPDVREIAKMAQLSVSEEEVKDWEPKINEIVDWFGQLRSVDLSNVPPAVRAGGDENRCGVDHKPSFGDGCMWDSVYYPKMRIWMASMMEKSLRLQGGMNTGISCCC